MRILIDTHSFLWFIAGDERCNTLARSLIADPDNEVLLSVASLWEIAIKVSLGKLILGRPYDELIPQQLATNAIGVAPISLVELGLVAKLPFHHRDPFDRLIVAQALAQDIPLLTADSILERYGVQRLWA